ncbi:MAG: aminotransferase class I/II-fold pyridoxal phosphate-dependent enzyme [Clostridia bacterium]|nr:aminotransferase class I/II-fold pyridoxal phosphate-dependent enzyme [Clostridia bacterium]
MIRFNNDYNHGAHPAILEALRKTNSESYGGYGLDPWCKKAAEAIKKEIGCPDAAVHFLVGGTQANYTVISAALRPFQSVIAADCGHIQVHETGAVEHIGHKIEVLPSANGKITAAQIAEKAELYRTSCVQEHITQPKMVYISYPTEVGSLYSKKELEEIRRVCDQYKLYLFVDGARMGYGLGSPESDLSAADLARLTDAFYFGGTKCGALFGEAVVLLHPALQEDFRSCIKQNGAMLAKGWLLGLQFHTLFENGLYFDITKRAVALALKIRDAFVCKGFKLYSNSHTNQQFIILDRATMEKLAEKYIFEFQEQIDENRIAVRFCTSWSTTEEEVNTLIKDIEKL